MGGEVPEALPNGWLVGAERGAEGEDEQAEWPISKGAGGTPSNGRCSGRYGGVSRCVWVRAPRGRETAARKVFFFPFLFLFFFFSPVGFWRLGGWGGRAFFAASSRLFPGFVFPGQAGGPAPGTEKKGSQRTAAAPQR